MSKNSGNVTRYNTNRLMVLTVDYLVEDIAGIFQGLIKMENQLADNYKKLRAAMSVNFI